MSLCPVCLGVRIDLDCLRHPPSTNMHAFLSLTCSHMSLPVGIVSVLSLQPGYNITLKINGCTLRLVEVLCSLSVSLFTSSLIDRLCSFEVPWLTMKYWCCFVCVCVCVLFVCLYTLE